MFVNHWYSANQKPLSISPAPILELPAKEKYCAFLYPEFLLISIVLCSQASHLTHENFSFLTRKYFKYIYLLIKCYPKSSHFINHKSLLPMWQEAYFHNNQSFSFFHFFDNLESFTHWIIDISWVRGRLIQLRLKKLNEFLSRLF